MAEWSPAVEDAVRQALAQVTYAQPGREHFGRRPFITAYQLAIKVRQGDPEVAPGSKLAEKE